MGKEKCGSQSKGEGCVYIHISETKTKLRKAEMCGFNHDIDAMRRDAGRKKGNIGWK